MWIAEFKNKERLQQFEGSKEIPFREVLNRQDDLEKFSILVNNIIYTVNLKTGKFSRKCGDDEITFFLTDQSQIPPPEYEYRIIYFQRCLQLFDNGLKSVHGEQIQCDALGWQTTTPEGKNLKRMIKIYPNNTFDIEIE